MAPLIGITCSWDEGEGRHQLHDNYIRAVTRAGGVPVLLPSLASPEQIAVYYRELAGFIFSGGGDLAPHHYGAEPLRGLGEITPQRDFFEMALMRLILAGEKPFLGICRGLQLLNVAAGGTLYQDLKGVTKLQHQQDAPRWCVTHSVQVVPESEMSQLLSRDSFAVNSFHHQGINQLGEGLRAAAHSKDGLIEALESSHKGKKIMAVQWHPECTWDRDQESFSFFKNLIECVS